MNTAIAEHGPIAKATKINIRAKTSDKKLIARAAKALEMTVSEFILPSAVARAKKALEDRGILILDQNDRTAFVGAFLNPPEPAEALRKAVAARKAQPPV